MTPDQETQHAITRRELLWRSVAGGAALSASGWLFELPGDALAASLPKRGGTLRVGTLGGTTHTLDPHAVVGGNLDIIRNKNVFSRLTDPGRRGEVVLMLAESIEPNRIADAWVVRLRPDVVFHDGSPLTPEDVIYTFQRILNPKLGLDSGTLSMVDPKGFKKLDKRTLRIKLKYPYSDFPAQVGTRQAGILKAGTKSFKKLNGTGAFMLKSSEPGRRAALVANRNYFEQGKPYLERLELINVLDATARVNGLRSGQLDAIDWVNAAQVRALRSDRGVRLVLSDTSAWGGIVMNFQVSPFNDVRVRQALRLLSDRQQIVNSVYDGYASLGNDLFGRFDPLYPSSLPQRKYDPEKAKFLLKQAGQENVKLTLQTGEAAAGMVGEALVFAQTAKAGGVSITIDKVDADTYWDLQGKRAFASSWWGGRRLFTQWLLGYDFEAPYNECHDTNKRAQALMRQAMRTVDVKKRKELAFEAQKQLWETGGLIISAYAKFIDAHRNKVRGFRPDVNYPLNGYVFTDVYLA